jgi:hypothetical protein
MPELTPVLEAARVAQAIAVLRLITYDGKTVIDACAEVGISERQYRFWLARGETAIDEFKESISALERVKLSQLTVANDAILDRIMTLAQTDGRLQDVIAASKHLIEVQHELEGRYGATGIGDIAAKEFMLSGPKTSKQPSKTGTTINIAPRRDGSIDVTIPGNDEDIIEGELTDESKDR